MPDHKIIYRNYQREALEATLDSLAESNSALIVMPTGSGKTVLAGMIAETFQSDAKKTLFLAHREVLVNQAFDTLQQFGLECAVEMGNGDARKYSSTFGTPDVVVGSVQSLQNDRLLSWDPDSFDLIIIDECHRSLADSYTRILNHFNRALLVGITATPRRGDGRNLGARFAVKSYEYSLRQAIKDEWLVPITLRTCPTTIDLRGLKIASNGDYLASELGERIGPLVEGLARSFVREIGPRAAVAFLPDVGSAMAFADVLAKIGMPARYVAGTGGQFGMPKPECKANLEAFNGGEYQVIVCCEILIEGWDCPKIESVGILRPTNQQYRFAQMAGRGTRPCPATGKTGCLIVDYDWKADPGVKELCSVIDIFDDGSLDDDVYAVAKQLVREQAVDVDPIKIIDKAERIVRTRRRFMIHLTGKELEYRSWDHDPVGVSKILDIKYNRQYELSSQAYSNPATDKQLALLRHLGVTTHDTISKWGASKIIDRIMKRREQHLASFRQVQILMGHGVDPNTARTMSGDTAQEAIRQILASEPKTQKTLL